MIPKKGDQDDAVRKFKEKLEAAKITNVTNIMTLTQLKRDYTTHSLKLKLCHTYDVFLVESKISEHVYSILGKHFIKKRKRPLQVDTSNDAKMKISIDNAIKKVTINISPKSLISSFEIGTAKMDNEKIVDNIMSAAEQLKEKWIGGWKNISRIYLRPMQPNDVDIPIVIGPKQKRLEKLSNKLQKKNDKVKLDPKTKKISNVFRARKTDESATATEKKEEGGKTKKRKNPVDKDLEVPQKKKKDMQTKNKKAKLTVDENETEITDVTAKIVETNPAKLGKKIKKKVNKLQETPEPETKDKKNKKKVEETPAVETAGKKKKNKKDTVAAVIKETALIKPEKKKKVLKDPQLSAVADDVVTKPKNKKKKTAALTEAINSEKSAAEVKKDQTTAANSKKKKSKKNKT
jgi:ribosome biogenesis protein UTP30